MANAVEKLFETVLSKLPEIPSQEQLVPREPRGDLDDADDLDIFDRPYQLPDEQEKIIPYPNKSKFRSLTEKDQELILGGIRSRGFDVLAFYKSKRFIHWRPFPGKWGIFYFDHGISYIKKCMSQVFPGRNFGSNFPYEFLKAHEFFHYQADIQTLMLEATLGKHLYIPVRERFDFRRSHFVEEAIANRQAYDWARNKKIDDFAEEFMHLQPNAYARFDEKVENLTGEWMANVVDGAPPRCAPRFELAPWVVNTPEEFKNENLCPEWQISASRLNAWISPVCITPPVKEISDDEKVAEALGGPLRSLQKPWEKTKIKLCTDKDLPGLHFKPWKGEGKDCYSVRVDSGNRAHLENLGNGKWRTYKIGSHKELGHG
jgi:hypothetical protein